jgi:hypothetical protein
MKPYLIKTKPALFILCTFSFLSSLAQDETIKKLQTDASVEVKKPEDTAKFYHKRGGTYSLNVAQGANSNWAAGGEDFSLAVTSLLNVYSYRKTEKYSWDNTLDLNFGLVYTTSDGTRKNDDRIDFLSKYGRPVSDKWNLATLVNFRTQFANGYEYEDDDVKTFNSAFLSPAYFLASLGFDYKPSQVFSLYLSPATYRLVIVNDDSMAAEGMYGVEKGENLRTEFGSFLSASFFKEFNTSISFKSRLDLFCNYLENPENVDVFMTNSLIIKINSVLAFNWNVDLIYDDNVKLFGPNEDSPALQLKSLVGIGLMVKF